MTAGQTFIISFLTAVVVSVGVCLAFRHIDAQPAATLEPVKTPERVAVPNLEGVSVDVAKARLSQLGLDVGAVIEEESATVPAGEVMSSDPPRFTELRKGLVVSLTVSKGMPVVEVPNVRRMLERKAIATLEKAGLKAEIKRIADEDFMFDRVLRQTPAAGETIKRGESVTITINSEDANW